MKLKIIYLLCFFSLSVHTKIFSQKSQLCQGNYWTEDEANIQMKKMATLWDDQKSWEARAQKIKDNIRLGLNMDSWPNNDYPFNPIILETKELDGYIVENVAIVSFPGFYITGNIYRPIEHNGKIPAILSPHGHWRDRRFMDEVQLRAAVLARMGAIVFVYDMIGYGESTQTIHDIPSALLIQTWNSKRVLDYLISREDVDVKRIGMTGASGGGTQTFILTALDDRIAVSVPAVQVSAYFFGGCVCESGLPIHRNGSFQTNNVEIAALAAPRPMLLISDGRDWTWNTPTIEFPYIQRVYSMYNAEHKVKNVHLPLERHDYGYSKRMAMYIFFANHLGLSFNKIPHNNNNLVDESFVTLLPKSMLQVFTASHPRPENALKGSEEVEKAINELFR